MDNPLTILKRDAGGRVGSSAEARAEAVVEYRRSGLSASAFAKMAGISSNTFWNGRRSASRCRPSSEAVLAVNFTLISRDRIQAAW